MRFESAGNQLEGRRRSPQGDRGMTGARHVLREASRPNELSKEGHPAGRVASALVGALGTFALHLLLLTPYLLGSGHEVDKHPTDEGAPSSGVPAMTVLFINTDDAPNDAIENQDVAKQTALLSQILVPVGDIKKSLREVDFAVEPDAEDSSKEDSRNAPGDQQGRAALFGSYLGQVTARISRAWLRPRTAIGAQTFSCWVQVDQDPHGKVLEITLKSCNGTIPWQISLVHAIESSSPLPAPPDPSVFTQSLTFEMSSQPFDPLRPVDGFEPDRSASANPAPTEYRQ
jgi:hypothetical protein